MADSSLKGAICDASVLIDYILTEPKILKLFSKHCLQIYVTIATLQEVQQILPGQAESLGLLTFEPSINQLQEASKRNGPLSFQDRLCFILSRDNNWPCISSDKKLISECDKIGTGAIWGLNLMKVLVEKGHLGKKEAIAIANKIAKENPYIPQAILKRFEEKL